MDLAFYHVLHTSCNSWQDVHACRGNCQVFTAEAALPLQLRVCVTRQKYRVAIWSQGLLTMCTPCQPPVGTKLAGPSPHRPLHWHAAFLTCAESAGGCRANASCEAGRVVL